MSLKVMVWVLEHSEERLGRRLVLLALAEYAHDDGTSAFPTVATIARKSRLSDRQVQRALRELEAAGAISRTGEAPSGSVIWTVSMAGYDAQGGDNISPGGVTNRADGMSEMSPDPFKKHPSERTSMSEASSGRDVAHVIADATGITEAMREGDRRRGVAPHEQSGKESAATDNVPPGSTVSEPSAVSRETAGQLFAPTACNRLAGLMLANDPKAKVAPRSKGWLDAMRRLVDRDGRDPLEIAATLEWCQADEFWQGVILSAPKFREKYPQLRGAMSRAHRHADTRSHATSSTSSQLAAIAARGSRDQSDPANELRRRAGGR